MDTPHVYHTARNIYEKPRICFDCKEQICNYPIPVSRTLVNSPDEPDVELDIQIYHCTKTLGHQDFHGNKRIKLQMRFQW